MYLSAERPQRKPRAELTEKAPNPPSSGKKKCPLVSCVFGPQATRASGENFHRRQGLLPTDMVFSPVIARGCTSSLGSWTQWFSLPFPITSAGMMRGSDAQSSNPRRGAPRRAPRRPPAPAGKFSPHAGAETHGNGISALATHPPLHADVPSLCWKEPPLCPPREATVKKSF